MNRVEIEYRVRLALDRRKAGTKPEDGMIEFKSEFVAPEKAARRLCGHANSARRQPIIWVIGVDEETGDLKSPRIDEMSNWWNQVASHFDDVTPAMTDHTSIAYDGGHVIALYFETDQSPYVIKRANDRLVMWREGVGTRVARRSDLLKLMMPIEPLPILEAPIAKVSYFPHPSLNLNLEVILFVIPQRNGWLSIPVHRCSMNVYFPNQARTIDLRLNELGTRFQASGPVHTIDKPDFVKMVAYTSGPNAFIDPERDEIAYARISIGVSHSPYRVTLEVPIARSTTGLINAGKVQGTAYTSENYTLNVERRLATQATAPKDEDPTL